jgi:signal transduction histidine kinase
MALSLPVSSWPRSWVGWRWRVLVLLALTGCVAVLVLMRAAVTTPMVLGEFVLSASSELQLRTTPNLKDAPSAVRGLLWIGQQQAMNGALLVDDRWTVNAEQRASHQAQRAALNEALAQGKTTWLLESGATVDLSAATRGVTGLPWSFWPLMALSLLLYLAAVVVVLARPIERNLVYAAMAVAQAINVALIAVTALHTVGGTLIAPVLAYQLRCAMDVLTAAALVHASAIHPHRHSAHRVRAISGWLWAGILCLWLFLEPQAPQGWWWVQATSLGGGLLATWQWRQAAVQVMHPLGTLMYRFALCGSVIYLVTTVLAAVSTGLNHPARQAAEVGATVWVVFFGLMLVLLPTMSRTHHLMREFALIAAVSTLATAVDLLFVATLSISNFTSLALALFLALGLYAATRQWLLGKVLTQERFTAERTFEAVFHVAREVQQRPSELVPQFAGLMMQLFDPLQHAPDSKPLKSSKVADDGSALWVPLPALGGEQDPSTQTLKLTFAARGKRLFVADDARLADRVREQLLRAVAFDQAVEQGRAEERSRIAQDLHDDIGARLLTLMYKATDADTEDYVRHTLKDLKTLTRGLAAANHCLSHASAEWKADAAMRLMTADCELTWAFVWDEDIALTVVQWSALTRVLRELVSNAIAHAKASRVEIDGVLERGTLRLCVADNGAGHSPQDWSHGLGLGGVRKRVYQLGGRAQWHEREGGGIVCEVVLPNLTSAATRTTPTSPGYPTYPTYPTSPDASFGTRKNNRR